MEATLFQRSLAEYGRGWRSLRGVMHPVTHAQLAVPGLRRIRARDDPGNAARLGITRTTQGPLNKLRQGACTNAMLRTGQLGWLLRTARIDDTGGDCKTRGKGEKERKRERERERRGRVYNLLRIIRNTVQPLMHRTVLKIFYESATQRRINLHSPSSSLPYILRNLIPEVSCKRERISSTISKTLDYFASYYFNDWVNFSSFSREITQFPR